MQFANSINLLNYAVLYFFMKGGVYNANIFLYPNSININVIFSDSPLSNFIFRKSMNRKILEKMYCKT